MTVINDERLFSFLMNRHSEDYNDYYHGKMTYALYGKEWAKHVRETFPDLTSQTTSENIFRTVVDIYSDSIMPVVPELSGFRDSLVSLITRGETPVIVLKDGTPYYPRDWEMISEGGDSVAVVFTRNLFDGKDYATFIHSTGETQLYEKDIPEGYGAPSRYGYNFVEETTGNTLLRFSLNGGGMGATLAALQDRVNHSILDQTIIAEMYARPFWYLLNVDNIPPNPYSDTQPRVEGLKKHDTKGTGGRVFTTSGPGPFGQLDPPTINDMREYHSSLLDTVSPTTGVPGFMFSPGDGTPPTGVALQVLSKRFNSKISAMREAVEPKLKELMQLLGVANIDTTPIWPPVDDLLQEAKDQHGLHLKAIGYPLEYISETVTPGVDLAKYQDDGYNDYLRDKTNG